MATFNFTEQAPSPETAGVPVPSGFGQEVNQANALLGKAIGGTMQQGAQLIQEHVQSEKDDEIRTDVVAGQAAANKIERQLAVKLETATTRDEIENAKQEALNGLRDYADGTSSAGVPNARWHESQQALSRLSTQAADRIDGLATSRTVKLARANTLAKQGEGERDYTTNIGLDEPLDPTDTINRPWAVQLGLSYAKMVGGGADVAAARTRQLINTRVVNGITSAMGRYDADQLKTLGERLRDGQFSDLTPEQAEQLAERADTTIRARKVAAERADAKLKADALDGLTGEMTEALFTPNQTPEQQGKAIAATLQHLDQQAGLGNISKRVYSSYKVRLLQTQKDMLAGAELSAKMADINGALSDFYSGRLAPAAAAELIASKIGGLPNADLRIATGYLKEIRAGGDRRTKTALGIVDEIGQYGGYGHRHYVQGKNGKFTDDTKSYRVQQMAELETYGKENGLSNAQMEPLRLMKVNQFKQEDALRNHLVAIVKEWLKSAEGASATDEQIRTYIFETLKRPEFLAPKYRAIMGGGAMDLLPKTQNADGTPHEAGLSGNNAIPGLP